MRFGDAAVQSIVAVGGQRCAAVLHGDESVPGIVHVGVAAAIRRDIAVGIVSDRAGTRNRGVLVLLIRGACLRRAVRGYAGKVAERVGSPTLAARSAAGQTSLGRVSVPRWKLASWLRLS